MKTSPNPARVDNRRLPLLWRTVLLLTVVVIAAQAVLYAWVERSVSAHLEQMDSEILHHAALNLQKRMPTLVANTAAPTAERITAPTNTANVTSSTSIDAQHLHSAWLDYDLRVIITDLQGALIKSDPSNFASPLPTTIDIPALYQTHREQQFVIGIHDKTYRALMVKQPTSLALIALPIDVHRQYLQQFNQQLGIILIAITLLLVSVAALSVYWGFAPLSTIVQKMRAINPERLDERIAIDEMPRELRPLAKSYNLMMTTLSRNFESLSRFSDNIAHELRTPLATLSTQTQVMLSKPRSSEDYMEQLHQQHHTLEQLSAMINNMLLLAKTQKGLHHSQLGAIDTEQLISNLIDYYDMVAEDRHIDLVKTGDFAPVLGDKGLLQRLFANLISNAVYYAAADSQIAIHARRIPLDKTLGWAHAHKSTLPSALHISISNLLDAPLTQAEADRLFERFYRHQQTTERRVGAGLGLSIVRTIVEAHHGTIDIKVNHKGSFIVHVVLQMASGKA